MKMLLILEDYVEEDIVKDYIDRELTIASCSGKFSQKVTGNCLIITVLYLKR